MDHLKYCKVFVSSVYFIDELISRLDRDDPLYKSYNTSSYSFLEDETQVTVYATTAKPYAKQNYGRIVWISMISYNSVEEKWKQLKKYKLRFLMNTKWNGQTYSLEKFTGFQRNSFVTLQEASDHANLYIPKYCSIFGFLIDNISNNDLDLQAAISIERINNNRMRNNFEKYADFLLPVCPYAKHCTTNNNNTRNTKIS